MRILYTLGTILLLSSCFPPRKLGTIDFDPPEPQIIIDNQLREFVKSKTDLSIVVRSTDLNLLLNHQETYLRQRIKAAIENELIQNSFIVRDWELFTSLVVGTEYTDYTSLAKHTNTDLILELTSFDAEVEYNTNKFVDKKGRTVTVNGNITMYGIKLKFKLISIRDNRISGTYEFNLAPCSHGCEYFIDSYGRLFRKDYSETPIKPYEFVVVDELERFIAVGTSSLIRELQKE